jgi:hypothetical protein
MDKEHTVTKSCEPFSTSRNGHRITIKPDNPAVTACIKNFLGMPTIPHRTVKIGLPILPNEPKQHFF